MQTLTSGTRSRLSHPPNKPADAMGAALERWFQRCDSGANHYRPFLFVHCAAPWRPCGSPEGGLSGTAKSGGTRMPATLWALAGLVSQSGIGAPRPTPLPMTILAVAETAGGRHERNKARKSGPHEGDEGRRTSGNGDGEVRP